MNKEPLKSKKKCLEEEFDIFRKKVTQYKYICLFGVGRIADRWGYEFVKDWSTAKILCFSDNNENLWGKTIIDDLKCIPPIELKQYGQEILCIILVGARYRDEIAKQLREQGTETIIVNQEWMYLDELIEKSLELKLPKVWEGGYTMGHYDKQIGGDERIAVYTCIVNGYDELIQPLVCDKRCDYYYLGLEQPDHLGVYQWINLQGRIPDTLLNDPIRINRYCKLHPNLFFPKYNYSIYVDGRVLIQKELHNLISRIGKIGIASYGLPLNDTYEHASALYAARFKGERREVIKEQMQKYATEGFPRFFGLTENGVMVREHHNKDCIRVMDTWWDEIVKYSRRDQLSFFYSLWKNGFVAQDLGYIDDTFRNGPEFRIREHKTDLTAVKYNFAQ